MNDEHYIIQTLEIEMNRLIYEERIDRTNGYKSTEVSQRIKSLEKAIIYLKSLQKDGKSWVSCYEFNNYKEFWGVNI